jgi:hypothetical protein
MVNLKTLYGLCYSILTSHSFRRSDICLTPAYSQFNSSVPIPTAASVGTPVPALWPYNAWQNNAEKMHTELPGLLWFALCLLSWAGLYSLCTRKKKNPTHNWRSIYYPKSTITHHLSCMVLKLVPKWRVVLTYCVHFQIPTKNENLSIYP